MAQLDAFDGIIFDYGGVLVFHQLEADILQLAALTGLDRKTLDERYWRRRQEYDSDALSLSEYWSDVANGVPLTDEALSALSAADTSGWMHYDPPMWEWIEELRAAGKRTAMLSNMPRDLGTRLRTETNRLNFFDHVTLSYEVRCAKPDPAIYESCLGGLGTAPERTLFFDDRMANVEAARCLGMAAIEFTGREDVLPSFS